MSKREMVSSPHPIHSTLFTCIVQILKSKLNKRNRGGEGRRRGEGARRGGVTSIRRGLANKAHLFILLSNSRQIIDSQTIQLRFAFQGGREQTRGGREVCHGQKRESEELGWRW